MDLAAWGSGVCAGDFDGDGRLDLYVTNWGPNALFRNRGDGTFEDVAARAGVAAGGWSTGCTFFDADGDGDLDLYVARYVETTWESVVASAADAASGATGRTSWSDRPDFPASPTCSSRTSATDGSWRPPTRTASRTASRAYGFGVVATDYDDDGFVDLFVANDSNPNFLYHNLGNGRFESVGLTAGVAVNGDGRAQAGMGADAGDYDGDSRMDLVLTTFAHDRYTLYHNVDGRHFEDASTSAGIAGPTFVRMGWGAAFFDADLDGKLDLFFANGHIFPDIDKFPQLGETYRQKNQLLLNVGTQVPRRLGTRGRRPADRARSAAAWPSAISTTTAISISSSTTWTTRRRCWRIGRRRSTTGWRCAPWRAAGNRFAIGAKVTVSGGGTRQVREIRSGGSFLSQNDLRAYFGLGDYAGPVDVEIRMPGGRRWEWKQLPSDRLHELTLAESASIPRAGIAR